MFYYPHHDMGDKGYHQVNPEYVIDSQALKNDSRSVIFMDSQGQVIIKLNFESGAIEVGPQATPTEAARLFVDTVRKIMTGEWR